MVNPNSGALIVLFTVGDETLLLPHIIRVGIMYPPNVPSLLGNMSLLPGSVSLIFWTEGRLRSAGSLKFRE